MLGRERSGGERVGTKKPNKLVYVLVFLVVVVVLYDMMMRSKPPSRLIIVIYSLSKKRDESIFHSFLYTRKIIAIEYLL